MTKDRVPLPKESDPESTRKQYLIKAKSWLDSINRVSYPIVWRGRVTEMNAGAGSNVDVQFQCVSADNKFNFGRPASIMILKSNALQLGPQLPAANVIWTLNATLEPDLNLDRSMLEPNTFDNPPLVGPFITFKYKLTSTRLFLEKLPRLLLQ